MSMRDTRDPWLAGQGFNQAGGEAIDRGGDLVALDQREVQRVRVAEALAVPGPLHLRCPPTDGRVDREYTSRLGDVRARQRGEMDVAGALQQVPQLDEHGVAGG